jgi:threonine aldolase
VATAGPATAIAGSAGYFHAAPLLGVMIDLRSDTVTKPSAAMRQAAADAEVGDDVYVEDPTVNELERRVADRLGMEAALYFPTGTMANQTAIRVHTDRGQEVICDELSHVFKWELSGMAEHASAQAHPVDGGERGTPRPEDVEAAYMAPGTHHAPGTGLLVLENTHNTRGGLAVDPERIDLAAEAAADLDVPTHLDGARLWNAAVAHDVSPARFTERVDSVMTCLSKGLGAPVGSLLAGEEAFIDRARDVRKLMGGGMRQVGVIANPGLHALENVERLAEDHGNATVLAEGIDEVDGLSVTLPETNIVIADTSGLGQTAEEFLADVEDAGVRGTEMDEYVARFVTHWDVDRDDVETAVERIHEAA